MMALRQARELIKSRIPEGHRPIKSSQDGPVSDVGSSGWRGRALLFSTAIHISDRSKFINISGSDLHRSAMVGGSVLTARVFSFLEAFVDLSDIS
jgi:hypothetical protein